MKTATFISGITAGLVLLTAAHAAINADPVGASFERDLNRVATPGATGMTVNADPLHALVNMALWNTVPAAPALARVSRNNNQVISD